MSRAAAIPVLLCCLLAAFPLLGEEKLFIPGVSVNIAAGDLSTALDTLAQQTGIEVLYDANLLKGVKTSGVSGRMNPSAAVAVLLQGTRLIMTESATGAMLIAAPSGNGAENSSASSRKDPSVAIPSQGKEEVIDRRSRKPVEPTNSDLGEVVVTGTHIRGELPVGSALIVYTRADLNLSGSATLDQFARQLTENFSGIDAIASAPNTNANFGNFQQGAVNNVFRGAGFNLNGLGPGSTLTLLDGHRLAAGGSDGSIVDISLIPLSAIDRIEVLDDGSSAIYGSDAVAGVVNIITRRNWSGAESSVRYGAATDGGGTESTASQAIGTTWTDGQAFLDYEFDDQGGLDASQRDWIPPQGGPYSLLPQSRRNSVLATVDQHLASETRIAGTVLLSDRYFASATTISVPAERDRQDSAGHASEMAANLSLDQRLAGDWTITAAGNYAQIQQREETSGSFSFADSSVQPIEQYLVADARTTGIDLQSSGTLLALPEGAVKMSLGASFRTERFRSDGSAAVLGAPITLGRHIGSLYAELRRPLVSDQNIQPWAHRLEVSAAYRYDHYSDFGGTTNPKYGLIWEPVAGLRVRGTYGTSFQAPLLSQLGAPITAATTFVANSSASGGRSDVLEYTGGNPYLGAEKARSVTGGIDYSPAAIPGLSLSATYFDVYFRNRIQAPNLESQAIFSNPLTLPFVYLNPSLSSVASVFSSPFFTGDSAGWGPAGVTAIVDDRLANLGSTVESGINLAAEYRLPTSMGDFRFALSGSHLFGECVKAALFVSCVPVDNTIAEPLSSKIRGGILWSISGIVTSLTANYSGSYKNPLFTPDQTIGSWMTAAFHLSYDTGDLQGGILQHIKTSFNVQNLFDRRPPNVQIPAGGLLPGQRPIPFDGANASPVGRFVSLQLTKAW